MRWNERTFHTQRRERSVLSLFIFLGTTLNAVNCIGRYKKCSTDVECCRHEVCAHGRICYPAMRCQYGCPDGQCRRGSDDDLLGSGYETCWPLTPCSSSASDCGLGNICTLHFNLGYPVCQYNLNIGSSLCYRAGGLGGGVPVAGRDGGSGGRRARKAHRTRLPPPMDAEQWFAGNRTGTRTGIGGTA